VIVPECVSGCASGVSVMACVSACEEMDDGLIQTGDMNGEPGRLQRFNLTTAPGSRDGAYEVHGAFHARPARVRLRNRNPARERSPLDTSQPRGRLKWRWRVLCEFGTDGSACEHVCEAPCVLFAERVERVPGKMRSCGPARETAQVRCASDVIGTDLAARVTCERRALARMADPSRASACRDVQGDDKAARIARWKGRTGKLKTAALAVFKKKKKKNSLPVHGPGQDVVDILHGHRSNS